MKRGETLFHGYSDAEKTMLRAWASREYPQLDFDATMIRFEEHADKWTARIWTSKFKRVIRAGIDNGYRGIVVFLGGREHDPRWQSILHEARKSGFREPTEHETPQSYRTELMLWQQKPKANVLPFGIIKRV